MTKYLKSKYHLIVPAIIAAALVGGFFLQNAKTSFASISDCLTTPGNLIKNCSFEIPGATPSPGYYPHSTGNYMFPAGYTGLTDWKVLAPVKASNIGYFMPGFPTPSGKEILDLSGFVDKYNLNMNGEQAGSGVEQTVSGLTVGQEYQLTFSQGYLAPFPSQIGVFIDGVSYGTFDLDDKTSGSEVISTVYWKEQVIKFTASSSTATIRFIHTIPQPGGKIVIYGSALDNVTLLPIKPRVSPVSVATPTPTPINITPTLITPVTELTSSGITATLSASSTCTLPGKSVTFTATVSGPGVNSVILEKDTNADGVYGQDTNPPLQTTSWNTAGTYTFQTNESASYTGTYALRLVVNGTVYDTKYVRFATTCRDVIETTVPPITQTPVEPSGIAKAVTIGSNYSNPFYATTGHVITLNYTLNKVPTSQRVMIGDETVDPVCIGTAPVFQCSAAIIVTEYIPLQDGLVAFSISAIFSRASRTVITGTTDDSYVIVDRSGNPLPTVTPPSDTNNSPTANPSGTGGNSNGGSTSTGSTGGNGSSGDGSGSGSPASTTQPPANPAVSSGGGSGFIPPNVMPQGVTTAVSGSEPTSVWGTSYTANGPQACSIMFTQYLRKGNVDGQRGIFQVGKIQKFLNERLHLNLSGDGIFDASTDQAVRDFQGQYMGQIITPWKLSDPTGWWYQSTRSYANYLAGCSEGPVRLDNGTWLLDGQVIK